MNPIVSYCNIGLPTYAKLHRWLGRVAVIKGLIYVVAAASYYRFNLHTIPNIAALTVSITDFKK
jgi:hypothetical protein